MAKLLHVFPSFGLGGSQARLVRLISAEPTRHEHLIISLDGDLSQMDLLPAGHQVQAIDGRSLMQGRLPWIAIRRALQSIRPDRLLTYNWGASDWAIAALGTGIAHVAVEDGFGPEEAKRRLLRRSLTRQLVFARGGSTMVVPSRTLHDIAIREWAMPAWRVDLIANGVHEDGFRPVSERGRPSKFQRSAGEWVIGTLAGLREEKRLDRLIDAVALIASEIPVRVVIGGVGPMEDALRQRCADQGLTDRIEFAGLIRHPADFLHELDAFVLSSDTEQLPISMIEAMLSGLPVAATDVGDIRRSLPGCQAPSLSAPDARSLAQALRTLHANRDRADAWGAANRAHALEHFSPQTMQARWNQVFDGHRSNHAGATAPRVLVFSSLFPCPSSPQSGIFIKERMFRVARQCPLVVVAPRSWSPFDGLIRLFRPTFRPLAPRYEHIEGIDIHRPTFFSLPGLLKRLDGWSMAQGSRKVMQQLQRHFEPTLVDAHFVYPDGYAASVLAKEQGLPLTITLRGSKDEWLIGTSMEPALRVALDRAQRIFSVSDALKRDVGLKLGQAPEKLQTVRNGVDLSRFHAEDRLTARARFGLSPDDQVIVSAGWLIERKGFHRIIPLLEQLAQRHARVKLMIVGSGTSQEDMGPALHELAQRSSVADRVLFCGALAPDEMRWGYSAGDVFALATSHEGWANVFLEAMACGLPVITTQVGGNQQVVSHPGVGYTVPYWDAAAFTEALDRALEHTWDRQAITEHAQRHSWEEPIRDLVGAFTAISEQRA